MVSVAHNRLWFLFFIYPAGVSLKYCDACFDTSYHISPASSLYFEIWVAETCQCTHVTDEFEGHDKTSTQASSNMAVCQFPQVSKQRRHHLSQHSSILISCDVEKPSEMCHCTVNMINNVGLCSISVNSFLRVKGWKDFSTFDSAVRSSEFAIIRIIEKWDLNQQNSFIFNQFKMWF